MIRMSDINQKLVGYSIEESNFKTFVGAYLERLDNVQKNSFAQLDQLIQNTLDGYDIHVLVLVKELEEVKPQNIDGLVIFNQESTAVRLPNGNYAIKTVIQHISTVDINQRTELFDQTLAYIWKNTHCGFIRINLFHMVNEEGKLKADPGIKEILKLRKFKWKTLINDSSTGSRYELLEV